jgi:hypothetical protein
MAWCTANPAGLHVSCARLDPEISVEEYSAQLVAAIAAHALPSLVIEVDVSYVDGAPNASFLRLLPHIVQMQADAFAAHDPKIATVYIYPLAGLAWPVQLALRAALTPVHYAKLRVGTTPAH